MVYPHQGQTGKGSVSDGPEGLSRHHHRPAGCVVAGAAPLVHSPLRIPYTAINAYSTQCEIPCKSATYASVVSTPQGI